MADWKKIRTLLDESAVGSKAEIRGWVRSARPSKAGLVFVQVHDGTCHAALQAVVPEGAEGYEIAAKLSAGAAVTVRGEVVASQGKGQSTELRAEALECIGEVNDPSTYPMQPKRHTMEHLRKYAHLRPRTNLIGAVARVRDCVSQAIHRFFAEEDFYWVHTPIVTTLDAEGAGEMFRVSTLDLMNVPRANGAVDFSQDFFGGETYLTVSGQLNVEPYAMALSRVYTFGPTFRAENSHTRRHLAEFWMVEPEIAFADLDDNVALAEKFLKYVTKAVLDERADDLAFFNRFVHKGVLDRTETMVETAFDRITYTDAIDRLTKADQKWEVLPTWGIDLGAEHEKYLTEVLGPVVVTDYPKDIKAFYMRQNDDGETVAAMDVLVPGIGEIIGGSQREERLDRLEARLEEEGLPRERYEWYLDLRRYGTAPHAGFGLGLERLVQYVTGVENIREVIPYPRSAGTAAF
ncbi:MAG: asparagine--tRNA ligase [Myxococcota bacterium]